MVRMVEFDGKKLERIFNDRGIFLKDASKEIGFDGSFFSKCIKRNSISTSAVKSLEYRFGIKYEDIKLDPEPEPEMPVESEKQAEKGTEAQFAILDYDMLKEVIFEAVYNAVKKAWSE